MHDRQQNLLILQQQEIEIIVLSALKVILENMPKLSKFQIENKIEGLYYIVEEYSQLSLVKKK